MGALALALQSNTWTNAAFKNAKKESKEESTEKIEYQELKEEIEFENILEKMNEIRSININGNLDDEQRRKNAENAILMMAKFFNLEDDEEE